MVTQLWREWVHAITGGTEVELTVVNTGRCTTVDWSGRGNDAYSTYADQADMLASAPQDIAEETDFWWIVAPSGVPGDGSGFDQAFISGGMGLDGTKPIFLSDDAWFTRKAVHLGQGAYTEAEARAYLPQWFQHEFMHHIFLTWPEFGLEDDFHQWHDRTTWPADFTGSWETDHYAESIDRRLMDATPSLAVRLQAPESINYDTLEAADLAGQYVRLPIVDGWHKVTVMAVTDSELSGSNEADWTWSFEIGPDGVWALPGAPHGLLQLFPNASDAEFVSLAYRNETYLRVDSTPGTVWGLTPADSTGEYERLPVGNDWHQTTLSVDQSDPTRLTRTNGAGASWGLQIVDGELLTDPTSPYGALSLVMCPSGESVSSFFFNGEVWTPVVPWPGLVLWGPLLQANRSAKRT
jgi:hypothetical protein